MNISVIVAVAENDVIGLANGQIPWHIRSDFQHFKRVTMGCPIIMGRKTHESIGRPLPGRLNIVLSRDVTYESKDCVVVHDAKSAFARAEQTGAQEAFVTGGTQIYTDMLPLASTIYLTRVHASPVGDAHFTFDEREWVQTSDEAHPANPENHDDFAFTFQIWKRR